jgi:hypothetical protein
MMIFKVEENNISDICKLFEDVNKYPLSKCNSKEKAKWLYFQNNSGKNYSRIMLKEKSMLAHWGAIPLKFKRCDKIIKGSTSFQLTCRKEALGSTLFLWREIEKELIDEGVVANYNFHNESSHPALVSMGWETECVPILLTPLRPLQLLSDIISSKNLNRVLKYLLMIVFCKIDFCLYKLANLFVKDCNNIKEVNDFDDGDYDQIWNEMSKSVDSGIVLNSEYMKWRYIEKPNNSYKILSYIESGKVKGYLVYAITEEFKTSIGVVMDIVADCNNAKVIKSLIRTAKRKTCQKGATIMTALSFKGNIFYQHFTDSWFFNVPKKLLPQQSYFAVKDLNKTDGGIPINRWHVSWGCHDKW